MTVVVASSRFIVVHVLPSQGNGNLRVNLPLTPGTSAIIRTLSALHLLRFRTHRPSSRHSDSTDQVEEPRDRIERGRQAAVPHVSVAGHPECLPAAMSSGRRHVGDD